MLFGGGIAGHTNLIYGLHEPDHPLIVPVSCLCGGPSLAHRGPVFQTRLHRCGLGLIDAFVGLGPHVVMCLGALLGLGPVGAVRAGFALHESVY